MLARGRRPRQPRGGRRHGRAQRRGGCDEDRGGRGRARHAVLGSGSVAIRRVACAAERGFCLPMDEHRRAL